MTRPSESAPRSTQEPESPVFDDAFLRRLERLRLRARRAVRPAGERPGLRRHPSDDLVEHRAYSPGDPLRHVDWHALARHDEVFVKLGRVAQGSEVCAVQDVSRSMAASAAKWRLAMELTAAIAWIALARGDRVRVLRTALEASDDLGPMSGPADALELMRRIAEPGASAFPPGPTRIGPALGRVGRQSPGGLLVIVSDLWLDDDLAAALGKLPAALWDVHVLQVLDRDELRPRAEGTRELVDSETGERLVLEIDEGLLRDYRAALRRRLDGLRSQLGARGAVLTLIDSGQPLESAILPLLRRRALVE